MNKDGVIYKHTLQRVMTQQEEATDVAKDKKLKVENLDVGPTMYNNNNKEGSIQ